MGPSAPRPRSLRCLRLARRAHWKLRALHPAGQQQRQAQGEAHGLDAQRGPRQHGFQQLRGVGLGVLRDLQGRPGAAPRAKACGTAVQTRPGCLWRTDSSWCDMAWVAWRVCRRACSRSKTWRAAPCWPRTMRHRPSCSARMRSSRARRSRGEAARAVLMFLSIGWLVRRRAHRAKSEWDGGRAAVRLGFMHDTPKKHRTA
jgi:hypothetical protein